MAQILHQRNGHPHMPATERYGVSRSLGASAVAWYTLDYREVKV
jgi:hypothetical protein